jgi:hypothetical protein
MRNHSLLVSIVLHLVLFVHWSQSLCRVTDYYKCYTRLAAFGSHEPVANSKVQLVPAFRMSWPAQPICSA